MLQILFEILRDSSDGKARSYSLLAEPQIHHWIKRVIIY